MASPPPALVPSPNQATAGRIGAQQVTQQAASPATADAPPPDRSGMQKPPVTLPGGSTGRDRGDSAMTAPADSARSLPPMLPQPQRTISRIDSAKLREAIAAEAAEKAAEAAERSYAEKVGRKSARRKSMDGPAKDAKVQDRDASLTPPPAQEEGEHVKGSLPAEQAAAPEQAAITAAPQAIAVNKAALRPATATAAASLQASTANRSAPRAVTGTEAVAQPVTASEAVQQPVTASAGPSQAAHEVVVLGSSSDDDS